MAQSQEADSLTTDYGDTIANSTMPEGLILEVVPFPEADQTCILMNPHPLTTTPALFTMSKRVIVV